MRHFKEGDILTFEDVRQSFQDARMNKGVLDERTEFSRFPTGKDGSILFNSEEEYEAALNGTVSFEEAFKW